MILSLSQIIFSMQATDTCQFFIDKKSCRMSALSHTARKKTKRNASIAPLLVRLILGANLASTGFGLLERILFREP